MKKKLIIGVLLAVVILPLVLIAILRPNGATFKSSKVTSKDSIGVIRVEGTIMGGRGGASVLGGAVVGADDLMAQLKEAREDENIKVVVLRINSPGGSSPASQEIGEEIDKLKASGKKVITSMGDMAASGGYWLAAKSDKIVANPASMTGSIGVIMELQNWQGLYGKLGISSENIKSGPHKDMGSSARQLTKEERQILQGMVDDIYQQFIDVVAEGRKMDREKVRKLADGRVYTGRQAKELGLVDQLGNYYDAIQLAKEIAGIKGEPKIHEFGAGGPWDFLISRAQSFNPWGLTNKELTYRLYTELLNSQQSNIARP